MKILLQRIDDGLYLAASGEWTNDPERAQNFESGHAALCYTLESPTLTPMQVVLKFQNAASDIRLRCYNEVEAGSSFFVAKEKKAHRPFPGLANDGSPLTVSSDKGPFNDDGTTSRAA